LIDVTHVSPCYEYRDRESGETPEAYGERLARELDDAVMRLGPRRVIAFCAETVGGATSGALPPVPGYFRRVREICHRHGILFIADEVMCGMGRTGTLHAIEQEGVTPDLIALAKGLGGGYQPVGAVLVHERILAAMARGSGAFQHGHTYIGHPVACAAALAVQQVIQRDRLLDAVATLGARLDTRLRATFDGHPYVGDIRGRGLLMAVEIVADRASKRPFDPALRMHARIKVAAMARGLMVYPMGGTVDGNLGDHVLLAPPFVASAVDIDEIVRRLAASIDAAAEECVAREAAGA
jgi:adenosylmethionine-8-amino-7-oxononanoate aminotransferase